MIKKKKILLFSPIVALTSIVPMSLVSCSGIVAETFNPDDFYQDEQGQWMMKGMEGYTFHGMETTSGTTTIKLIEASKSEEEGEEYLKLFFKNKEEAELYLNISDDYISASQKKDLLNGKKITINVNDLDKPLVMEIQIFILRNFDQIYEMIKKVEEGYISNLVLNIDNITFNNDETINKWVYFNDTNDNDSYNGSTFDVCLVDQEDNDENYSDGRVIRILSQKTLECIYAVPDFAGAQNACTYNTPIWSELFGYTFSDSDKEKMLEGGTIDLSVAVGSLGISFKILTDFQNIWDKIKEQPLQDQEGLINHNNTI